MQLIQRVSLVDSQDFNAGAGVNTTGISSQANGVSSNTVCAFSFLFPVAQALRMVSGDYIIWSDDNSSEVTILSIGFLIQIDTSSNSPILKAYGPLASSTNITLLSNSSLWNKGFPFHFSDTELLFSREFPGANAAAVKGIRGTLIVAVKNAGAGAHLIGFRGNLTYEVWDVTGEFTSAQPEPRKKLLPNQEFFATELKNTTPAPAPLTGTGVVKPQFP